MIRLRETRLSDAEAVRQVEMRNGLPGTDPERWRTSWESHPQRALFAGVPIGWVLEDDETGSLVGTIANIQMAYDLGGRTVKAAAAGNWCVDAAHRASSLKLKSAYFRQAGIDLWLNGSASRTTAQILPSFKAVRIPSPAHDVALLWVAHHRRFAAAALRRKGVPLAGIAALPVGLALAARDLARGSGGGAAADRVERFDDNFDAFWDRLRRGALRLRAPRTRAMLEWRFRDALTQKRAAIITTGAEMTGYAVLVRRTREGLGLEQYVVADLQAVNDDAATIARLLSGAVRVTRDDGLDLLEMQGWNASKRAAAQSLRPMEYQYPVWQAFYKAQPELQAALAGPDAWDFSFFDTF